LSTVAKFENLKDLIVQLRGQSVLLDSDVAAIYKVETKRVNEAVKNNPDKFPHDYMFEITEKEFSDLRSKFSTTKFTKTRSLPKAFTEKGLYMIATILKSKQAIRKNIIRRNGRWRRLYVPRLKTIAQRLPGFDRVSLCVSACPVKCEAIFNRGG
jgi:hypothetical protein